MPKKVTDLRYEDTRYVSIADYIRRVNDIDNIQDKIAFSIHYLLDYGTQQRDVSLAEAIHVAKVKIAEESAKIRRVDVMVPDEQVVPRLSDEKDAPNRQFMIEPGFFLMNEANRLLFAEMNEGITIANQARIEKYQAMSSVLMNGLNNGLEAQISELDIQPTSRDIKARLAARYGGVRQFENALNATKPGFFAKLFNRPSKAYSNLEQVYKAFNNPHHVLYGDMNSLDKAATEYLQHCFPTWNPKNGMISKSSIERLSGAKKDRALLSFNILKSTAEQRPMERTYENIISANIQLRADREANVADDSLELQQNLANDIANEENSLDSSQIERDYHNNFAEIEEEQDPPEGEPSIE